MKHLANIDNVKNIRTYYLLKSGSFIFWPHYIHVSCGRTRDTWHVWCYLSTRGKIGNPCKKRNKYGASGLVTTVSVSIVTDESRIVVANISARYVRSFIPIEVLPIIIMLLGLVFGGGHNFEESTFSVWHIVHRKSPSWIKLFFVNPPESPNGN